MRTRCGAAAAPRSDVRVLHVIQELAAGGAERVTLSLAKATVGAGGEAAVVAAAGPLGAEFPGRMFRLPLLERRPARLPAAVLAVARAIRETRPDLVHAHNPGVALAVAAATLRGRRPPAVVTMHGVPDEEYGRTARLLRLSGLPVVACGPGVSAALEAEGLRVRAMIPNSVSDPPEALPRETLEREFGLANGMPLVAAVGRLVHQKNHELAIRALADVPDAMLVIAGDGPLRSELERTARQVGVAERVVLAGLRPDARSIVRAADAAVLPSRWEGLPLAGIEALAGGTPLVATAVRGIREVFEDGRDAVLVPAGDPAALASALRRVLADKELRGRLRAAGLQKAAQYDEKAMVEQYFAVYRSLV
jgi:glycosyltransferase involved in cell wall biosynthesis